MKVEYGENGSVSIDVRDGIPAIVFVLEADAPPRAIQPADDDACRRVLLGLSPEWLELVARALGFDIDELLADDG